MNIDEIKTIVELMSKNDLTEFKVEADGYNLCLKRGSNKVVQSIAMPAVAPIAAAPVAPVAAAQVADAPAAAPAPGKTIDAPLVGTFYRAPSPDATPYAKVGDVVTPETVVCIIEAMKVMNEVKAETSGVVKDILVSDGTAVEYGQPLLVIE